MNFEPRFLCPAYIDKIKQILTENIVHNFRDYPGDAGIPMRPVKLANGGAQDHRSR